MGLGVLDVRNENVPGTSFILDDDSRTSKANHIDSRLKYDTSKKGEPIILVPQPSDDPNDPLNWPLWRRDLALGVLCLMSVIASTLSPLLAANTFALVLVFKHSFTDMALLTGYHLCGVGAAGFIFVASARKWGKRHLYILGCVVIIASSAWGGASHGDYRQMLGARILQGVGLAPFEALVNASVGDLYFVHQRGVRMALSNMSLFGGAFFTPIIVGKMTESIGWEWTFYFVAIFSGVCLPLIIFFVPETAYRRDDYLNTDIVGEVAGQVHIFEKTPPESEMRNMGNTGAVTGMESPGHSGSPSFDRQNGDVENHHLTTNHNGPGVTTQKWSYARSLKLVGGPYADESWYILLFRPLPLFFHPAIFWACLTQGAMIGWTVLIGVVLAAIFFGPPLYFTEVETGYMYTGAFIGAIFGFILAGLLSDWSTKVMIRRNKGVYEPEFRIILVVAQLIAGCAGLYGFGIVAGKINDYGRPANYVLPDFFFGLEVCGMVLGAVASALYIVDAHREIAVEAFTCLLIFKNIFSFILTFFSFDWLATRGTRDIFIIIASVQVGICLLSVPMYVFGKKNRWLMHRFNILKTLKLE